MRGEQRRAHVDADVLGDAPRRAKLPALVRGIESVTRLDLDGRDAFGRERRKPRPAGGDELVVARCARRAHRRVDTAALPRDFRVGRAALPRFELVRPIARVDEMRVAIDEAGCGPRAGNVQQPLRGGAARQVALGADPRDPPAPDTERAVANRAVRILAGARHRREMRAGDQHVEHRLASRASSRELRHGLSIAGEHRGFVAHDGRRGRPSVRRPSRRGPVCGTDRISPRRASCRCAARRARDPRCRARRDPRGIPARSRRQRLPVACAPPRAAAA